MQIGASSPLLVLALGLVLGGAVGGCREGSRRDMVTTRSSSSTSASVTSSASSSAPVEVVADAESADAAAVDATLAPGTVVYGQATLTGKLVEETFYGPPGYGSDPGHDKKELVLILQLPQSIDVLQAPDAGSEFDVERLGVSKVSLTDPKDAGVDLHKLIGQRIVVRGTLFGAHTGHHHTDVLMSGVEVVPQ